MAEAPARSIDLGRLAPGLAATCDEYLVKCRAQLDVAVRAGEGGTAVARKFSRSLDGLLGALYCASDAAARVGGRGPRGRVALVAVGGWGRGLVGLRSDLDVLFLCDDPQDPHVASLADGVLYPLWDLGVSIGHAVRGVEETVELARSDLRTATTLLDARAVAGQRALAEELQKAGRRALFDPGIEAFLDALQKDTQDRHERFGGSLYLLEPEVKLGRGGLRDLDVARWAARARWGAATPEELVRLGAVYPRELRELEAAEDQLWKARSLLHLRAGRQQDRLTFEDQEEVAQALGFVDGAALGVEQFMQVYYRHARVVAQAAERVFSRARPEKRRESRGTATDVGGGVLLWGEHVTLADSELLAADPCLALRFYAEVARRELPPYPYARDAIARAAGDADWRKRLRESAGAAELFLKLLGHVGEGPVRRGSLLGELHEVGLLLAMVPEFEPVTGRVQHDLYHMYTVDIHSVAAVDRLRALARGELAQELPLASRVAAESPRPVPLFFALLVHDLGKGSGKDHSKRGALLARTIAPRFGLSPIDVDHVVWLVQEHLSLYHWAMRRDTSDPETIAEVGRLVGSVDRLRDLYLLTVADLSTTNPQAMTSWKARMLDDLYVSVAQALEGGGPTSPYERADELRADLRVRLLGLAAPDARRSGSDAHASAEYERFIDEMPARYVLANPPAAILAHARIACERGGSPVHVAVRPGTADELTELVVVTDDRPGLLADLTAALTANRLAVSSAQIYTRARYGLPDEAVDLFHVRRVARGAEPSDTSWLPKLAKDIDDLVSARVTPEALLAARPRPPAWARRKGGPEVPTEVRVDNGVDQRFTVVDVFTRDRVGLLHAIARALHEQGLTIALSKINTEGLRVADVFYVEQRGGGKVQDAHKLTALTLVLRETIARLDADVDGAGLADRESM
jgi:[protein-PII] uridylyltransferase